MNSVARPWYATNARDLLEHRRRNLKPVEPVIVSLVGGDFRDVAETVLYARRDMPVDRMDWRMLVDLDVWLWAGTGAAMDWITETAWRIAQARPLSRHGLDGLPGVGAAKLERYGAALLEVIARG